MSICCPIGISPDRIADPAHIHGETRLHVINLRVFLSGAVGQEPDRQGRVLVPQMLRDYANLGSDIVVIGVGTRAEIWNKQAWEEYLAEQEQGYSDIADDVLPAVEF